MKYLLFLLIITQSALAIFHISPQDPRLSNRLQNIQQDSSERIIDIGFSKGADWFIATNKNFYASNSTLFRSLRIQHLNSLKSGKKVLSVSLNAQGEWVIIHNDGSYKISNEEYFTKNSLIASLNRAIRFSRPYTKVVLGPRNSWFAHDARKKYFTKNLPQNINSFLTSFEHTNTRLNSFSFRTRERGFHWAAVSGGRHFKTGEPSTNLGRLLKFYNLNKDKIEHVALGPNDEYIITSNKKWKPNKFDILSNIELDVIGGVHLLERMRIHKVPGLLIGHIRGGRLYDIRMYGYRKTDTYEPLNAFVRLGAASMSKTVAVSAIMKAHEQGEIDINDDLMSWFFSVTPNSLPNVWKRSLTPFQEGIISQAPFYSLLNHSAGLTVSGIGSKKPGDVPTLYDILLGKNGREKTIPFRASLLGYKYSGGGYTLAEAFIEARYKQKFARFVKDKMLSQVGMIHSSMGELSYLGKRNYFHPHKDMKTLDYRVCGGKAAGGLFTSMQDYAKYVVMLANNGKASPSTSRRILKFSSMKKMLTPAYSEKSTLKFCTSSSACSAPEICYQRKCMEVLDRNNAYPGLGLMLSKRLNTNLEPTWFEHGGSQHGVGSKFRIYRDKKDGLIIFGNGDCYDSTDGRRGSCRLASEIINKYDQLRKI